MARHKKKTLPPPRQQPKTSAHRHWVTGLLSLLAGSGILVALLGAVYQHYSGNVSLEFVQTIGRAYEFQLKNDTPSDRTVKKFRVEPPRTQKVIYKITEDMYAQINDQGQVRLPGGNISYVPAAEFKELDGQKLLANSSLKFRIPPLSSSSSMQPEATIVDIRFEIEAKNQTLATLDSFLDLTGIRSRARTIRFLVIENYWTISNATSPNEAIRVFCRENDSMANSSACINERKASQH
jgi:hypothetical protein